MTDIRPESPTPGCLMLPAPSIDGSKSGATEVQQGTSVKLDELGPMVVNSNGTLSRIANWSNLSEMEKERTLRVLGARNKIRLANEENKLREESTGQPREGHAIPSSTSEST